MCSGNSLAYLLVMISCFIANTAGYSATFIKPCKRIDKACLISSTQAAIHGVCDGIKELDIPSLDPLFVKSGKLDNGNLLLKYTDMHVKGIRGIKIFDVEWDNSSNTVKIEAEMPIDAVGQYVLDGKILFLNLYGKGDFRIKTNKANFTTKYKIKHVNGPDGEQHWKIASFDYTYDIIEKVSYQLENLLGGSESSGKLVQEVLDTNWKDIALEFGDPIVREIVVTVLGHINKILLMISAKELEID